MDLTWSQNLVYGFISGLSEILPVSAQAHRLILRKIFGTHSIPEITMLLIHIGILVAVFVCCQNHLLRIHRALHLARIPKKRRKRPLDLVSLMDFKLLQYMFLPVLLGFILFHGAAKHENNIFLVSALLFFNGIILYIPQYLPGSNRDARTLSSAQGMAIGIASSLCALPGISAIGVATSVGQSVGEDRKYGFHMALLMELGILFILIFMDFLGMAAATTAGMSFTLIMQSILAGAAACGGTFLGIRIMRRLAETVGFTVFSYYCWAAALFSLILTLFA